ncbi:glycosyltransferase family 2 protein [Streptococcus suis]|uniref:glycosyltransferase family 2 protein n=1 Tax=Streptococcus suis TaxID=1307 RepID=UPI0005CE54E3|nr:glycosyltransferase family 2 protein [Streptococcus suis]MBY4975710.1 glycosyltransferase [Streptococcus suis]NQN65426.1 glycosyltransferase family 2 protein [Streptococcus suis]CYV21349.1 glycosyl transferase%2C family 2 [Streptococcus suis]HEM3669979.1 glycosyltransferase family 2 protein [Streptococcus suis]HEM3686123.1 glycosyltransferase family 2 protein [Streptococcus suis]
MNKPLISIIVPVYNVENYLDECIQTVLAQTYSNWELLLINDGSTDSSGTICDDYAKGDERIRVVHKNNGGLSDARNAGINNCTGEYITFLDSDDGIREDFLETCLTTAIQHDVDIVIGHFFIWDENQQTFYYFVEQSQKDTIELISAQEALNRQVVWKNFNTAPFVVAWGKVFKATLFNTIRFPKGKVFEDEYTIHKALLKSDSVALINKEFYMYRRHGNSIMTSDFSLSKVLNNIEALEERIVDLVLAKKDTELVRQKLYNVLLHTKHELEVHQCSDSLEYLRVLNKLELFNS